VFAICEDIILFTPPLLTIIILPKVSDYTPWTPPLTLPPRPVTDLSPKSPCKVKSRTALGRAEPLGSVYTTSRSRPLCVGMFSSGKLRNCPSTPPRSITSCGGVFSELINDAARNLVYLSPTLNSVLSSLQGHYMPVPSE